GLALRAEPLPDGFLFGGPVLTEEKRVQQTFRYIRCQSFQLGEQLLCPGYLIRNYQAAARVALQNTLGAKWLLLNNKAPIDAGHARHLAYLLLTRPVDLRVHSIFQQLNQG